MKDKSLLRQKRLEIRLTDSEFQLLQQRQQQTQATSLSDFLRSAVLSKIICTENVRQITDKFKENKESNKENKENRPSSSAREKIFSWLTENGETMRVLCMREKITVEDAQSEDSLREALEPYIEEFWRGLIAEGGDLYQLDPFDTRRHFSNWLRKYRRKEEMDGVERPAFGLKVERKKPDYQIEEQMLMKRRREEKAAELLRKLDAQSAASEDAKDAMEAFFAKRLNYKRNEEI